jgi:uncharacterized protein involved in exopolysaccharide biosynthesis
MTMRSGNLLMRDIQYWIEIIFRRRVTIQRVLLGVVGLVALGSLIWPPMYESRSKVLVQPNAASMLVSPGVTQDSDTPRNFANPVTEEELNSEVEILTNPYLIEDALESETPPAEGGPVHDALRAVDALTGIPAMLYGVLHKMPNISGHDAEILKLQSRVSVALINRSNVVEVTFRSHDAAWCQKFLCRLMDAYLALHARVSHDPQAESFFEAQAGLLRAKLNHSEDALRGAQLQTGIMSLPDQKQQSVLEYYTLDTEYRKTLSQLSAVEQQIGTLGDQLKTTPHYTLKESRVVQNLALSQLKPQVLQMEAERAELLSRYQPTSQRIRDIDAKLDAARKILSRENHTEVQESTNDINPTWADLDAQLAQSHTQVAALAASRDTLTEELGRNRQRMNSLTSDGVTIERLQREVDTDKEAYLSYIRKGEEARAAEALNQRRILNVSIVQAPTDPLLPIFPNVALNFAAALMLGLMLGIAAAFFEEWRDQRIYSAQAIREYAGVTTLAVLRDEM